MDDECLISYWATIQMEVESLKFQLYGKITILMNNQVPDAFSRCAPDTTQDAEEDKAISTLEVGALVVNRRKSMAQKNKGGISDEEDDEVDAYDVWDELQDAEKIETTEAWMEISIREVDDAQN